MSRFALPVFDSSGEIERYNIFQVVMIVRHAEDGKMYLYDMMEQPFPVIRPYSVRNPFLSLYSST